MMLVGMISWGACYTAAVVAISIYGTPAHKLPAYILFESACLLPWFIWLLVRAYRKGRAVTIAVIGQACTVAAVSYIVQIVATNARFWDYFGDKDILTGIRISGVPLEEFLFYPLTINFSIMLYLWICDYLKARRIRDFRIKRKPLRLALGITALVFAALATWVYLHRNPADIRPPSRTWEGLGIPRYTEGPLGYGWTITCLLSVSANLVIFYFAELATSLNLRAVISLTGIFLLVCVLVESFGTGRGWWVYNSQQVSGLWVAGVPLESFPAYLTAVMMPISLFEYIRRLMGERGLP
jgi:hypothetical protein